MSATPEQLERMYEALAVAIDRAGPDDEALFLARLALALGNALGDPEAFEAALAIALDA
ncbi:MAG: DUF2783 domain-containing protein [Proteobacteria bacterium]|nr:DUF2783 domain-containing protein [Pseudomonadota bacterium]